MNDKFCSNCGKPIYSKDYCRNCYIRNLTHGDPNTVLKRGPPAKKCTVPGCDEDHVAHGYCSKHNARLIRHGDVNYVRPVRLCSEPGCNEKHYAHDCCVDHYRQFF